MSGYKFVIGRDGRLYVNGRLTKKHTEIAEELGVNAVGGGVILAYGGTIEAYSLTSKSTGDVNLDQLRRALANTPELGLRLTDKSLHEPSLS